MVCYKMRALAVSGRLTGDKAAREWGALWSRTSSWSSPGQFANPEMEYVHQI